MAKLTIAGPNLTTGATFHVHKAGCRDLKSRAKGYGPTTDVDTGEYESLREIVEEIYSDHMAENDEDSPYAVWTGYIGEFDIYPCVGNLPNEQVEAEVPAEPQETSESSLPTSPEGDNMDSSKAAPTKGRSRKAKEATVSTKTNTKTTAKNDRRTWNKKQANMVVSRRNKGMSWAAIGNELGFSPRTTRSMFDSVKGEGAHYDSRLEGKGGRTRSGVAEAKAKIAAALEAEAE